jgi:hypothetical protein
MYCDHEWHIAAAFGVWENYGAGLKKWRVCLKCAEFRECVGFEPFDNYEDALNASSDHRVDPFWRPEEE